MTQPQGQDPGPFFRKPVPPPPRPVAPPRAAGPPPPRITDWLRQHRKWCWAIAVTLILSRYSLLPGVFWMFGIFAGPIMWFRGRKGGLRVSGVCFLLFIVTGAMWVNQERITTAGRGPGGAVISRESITTAGRNPEGPPSQGSITTTKADYAFCVSKRDLDRVVDLVASGDKQAFRKFIARNPLCGITKAGVRVHVTKMKMFSGTIKIRPTGDPTEVWTFREAVN